MKNPIRQARSSRWMEYCALNRSIEAPAGASNAIVAFANSGAVPALTRLVTRMPPEAWWRVGQVSRAAIVGDALPVHELFTPPGAASQATTS